MAQKTLLVHSSFDTANYKYKSSASSSWQNYSFSAGYTGIILGAASNSSNVYRGYIKIPTQSTLNPTNKHKITNINITLTAGSGSNNTSTDMDVYLVPFSAIDSYKTTTPADSLKVGNVDLTWNNANTNNNLNIAYSSVGLTQEDKALLFIPTGGKGSGYKQIYAQSSNYPKVTFTYYEPYTITYNANGGSGAPAAGKKVHGDAFTLSSTKPTRTGYTFQGWSTSSTATTATYTAGGTLPATINANTTLYAVWKINSYTVTISHWAWGFKNQEGNNGNKTGFKIDTDTFSANYNSSVVFDESRATTIPNGFYHWKRFISSGYTSDSSYEYLDLPVTKTQPAKNTSVEYDYNPTSYTITYNLDGGTNNSSNPSSYTVLYGVTLAAPTRENYEFLGWQDQNGNIITGINEGENATFASADELYTKLATRTTGNIEVTALWKATSNTWIKQNGSWVRGLTWIKTDGIWKKGLIYLKDSGTWKQGK